MVRQYCKDIYSYTDPKTGNKMYVKWNSGPRPVGLKKEPFAQYVILNQKTGKLDFGEIERPKEKTYKTPNRTSRMVKCAMFLDAIEKTNKRMVEI